MSALLKISGAVLAILGLALGALTFITPGKMDVYGIKLDTAAILLVGGILALGLAGVIDTLRGQRPRATAERVADARPEVAAPEAKPSASFSRKPAEAAAATAMVAGGLAAAAEAASAKAAAKPASDSVADTITALEQAKADVIRSMGGMDAMAKPATPEPAHAAEPVKAAAAAAEPEAAEEPAAEESAEEDLYVVEEKIIRGRPARVLSDETVEAETDEGWMRFENLDHLNEYLDSVEEQTT
ncbi:MAG: hypothetical protein KGO53_00275 [Alphaproteobacteria bacterium]|nr:hypothetical protein [Alphaproteobacteria bacterium]